MSKRSIVHIEIPAANPKSTGKFYADLFDWSVEGAPMDYTMFTSGNVPGGFPKIGGTDELAAPERVLIYVESPDIEADLKKAVKLGGKVAHAKTEIPNMGWWAAFTDPTGNTIGLFTGMPQS